MKLVASLEGQEHRLDVKEVAPNLYRVVVDDRESIVDAHSEDGGHYSLLVQGRSYTVDVEGGREEGTLRVLVEGAAFAVEVLDECRARVRRLQGGRHRADGPQSVVVPMPGKVVKVLVRAGDEVQEGQGIVVVEAMKMENELRAPRAGKVTLLRAEEGQTVEGGAVLAVIE